MPASTLGDPSSGLRNQNHRYRRRFAGGKLANWLPADRARMIVTAVGTVLTVAYFVNG